MESRHLLIPGFILTLLSAYLILSALIEQFRNRQIKRNGIRVKGKVTDTFFEDEEKAAARITVHYKALNNLTYKIEPSTASVKYKKMKGKETDVMYHRDDPSRAYVICENSLNRFFLLPLFFIMLLCGLAMVMFAMNYL